MRCGLRRLIEEKPDAKKHCHRNGDNNKDVFLFHTARIGWCIKVGQPSKNVAGILLNRHLKMMDTVADIISFAFFLINEAIMLAQHTAIQKKK